MNQAIQAYNKQQTQSDFEICNLLFNLIEEHLVAAESKIWHGHPVWFLNENPIVGYSKLKNNVQLLFWSGESFLEPNLLPKGKFKAAEAKYNKLLEINIEEVIRWLSKSKTIQWDYKNLIKKGQLDLIEM